MSFRFYVNRTYCEVLEEMRACYKTLNFSMMASLIEELQVLGNRMEGALSDESDLRGAQERKKRLKKEIRELEQKKKELNNV